MIVFAPSNNAISHSREAPNFRFNQVSKHGERTEAHFLSQKWGECRCKNQIPEKEHFSMGLFKLGNIQNLCRQESSGK